MPLSDLLKRVSAKPRGSTARRRWLRRPLRHLLKGPAHLIDMRIVDRVGFESMRGGDFAHVIDVGVADGTFDLYARFPGAFLELFEPDPRYYASIDAAVLTKRKGRLHRVALGNARGTTTLYLSGP